MKTLNEEDAAKKCLKAIECCTKYELCEECPYSYSQGESCTHRLMSEASRLLGIYIPMKVTVENWSPNICPNCGKEIDEHMGDGYYSHPEYDRCPYCLQKLYY